VQLQEPLPTAPIYRLNVAKMAAALTWLVREGYLKKNELDAISRVELLAQQINHGLDRTALLIDAANVGAALQERARVTLKASHLLRHRGGGPGKIAMAQAAIRAARYRLDHWIRTLFRSNSPSEQRPERRRPLWKSALTLMVGVITGVVVVGLTPWFAPALRLVEPGGKKIKLIEARVDGSKRVELLQVDIDVRNKGFASGNLAKCTIEPFGVYPVPPIEIVYVQRIDIRPFATETVSIQMRRIIDPSNARMVTTWQILCTDNRGQHTFNQFYLSDPMGEIKSMN
jgi:hypothetical protein